MEVRFYATLRPLVGGKRVDLDVPPGDSVRDLLEAATCRFPALEPLIWTPDRKLGQYIKVFVDGRDIHYLDELETVVTEDAVVDIFPPVAGGRE